MCMFNVHGGNIIAIMRNPIFYSTNTYHQHTEIPAVVSTSSRGSDANPKLTRNGERRRRQQPHQQHQQHGGTYT